MGTRWTVNRKRSRGEGVESARNVRSAPTTNLSEVDPDAGHEGEFIITILREGYQRNVQGFGIDLPRGVSNQQSL